MPFTIKPLLGSDGKPIRDSNNNPIPQIFEKKLTLKQLIYNSFVCIITLNTKKDSTKTYRNLGTVSNI